MQTSINNMNTTNLLEKDPIGAFNQINEMYLKYLQSAFKTRYKKIEEERLSLLKRDGNAYQDPYIEILPEYEETEKGRITDWKFDDFKDCFEDETQFLAFINLVNSGLIGDYVPHLHQVNMLKKGMIKGGGRAVVTSGTGSGKTEAFMLPLLGQILKEANDWDAPGKITDKFINQVKTLNGNNQLTDFEFSRSHENRPPAIRAIVLYPMNALVADQMVRLRKALDSDAARNVFKGDYFKENRIYFGRYNSEALPTGKKLSDYTTDKKDKKKYETDKKLKESKITEIVNEFTKYNEQALNNKKVIAVLDENPELQDQIKKDTEYIYPRQSSIDNDTIELSSEMLTRWDMQEYPPDILITNYSMLNIMLMRKAEADMFDKTKLWLTCEDENTKDKSPEEKGKLKGNRKFHIVIDELHLYRGAAGTEIAYLIRCLYRALGLEPMVNGKPNEQLRILCSSASLGIEEKTKEFLADFFNLDKDSFEEVKGEAKYKEAKYKECNENLNKYFVDFIEKSDIIDEPDLVLFKKIVYKAFYNESENRLIPLSIVEFSKKIFPNFVADPSLSTALRNLFIWRGAQKNHESLPRFRFHGFYKFIEGMWAELPSEIKNIEGNEDEYNLINEIHFTPKIIGTTGNKILELLRCEQCTTVFFGGEKTIDLDDQGGSIITLGIENTKLEEIPGKSGQSMAQNKKYHEYGIFWPFKEVNENVKIGTNIFRNNLNTPVSWLPHENNIPNKRATWYKATLNIKTGQVEKAHRDEKNYIDGHLYTICELNNPIPLNDNHEDVQKYSAIPNCCPSCGTNFRTRIYTKSPIRNFRAGLDQSNQILSKELFYQLKEKYAKDEKTLLEGRKLVSFTDSREEAAKQAFGIEREHFRILVQELLIAEIENQTTNNPAKNRLENLNNIEEKLKESIQRDETQILLNGEYPSLNKEIEIIYDYIERPNNLIKKASYDNLIEPSKNSADANYIIFKNLIEGSANETMGPIVKNLLELGINPLGVGKEFETIKLFKKGIKDPEIYPWYKLFDLTNLAINVNFLKYYCKLSFHAAIDEEDDSKEYSINFENNKHWEKELLEYIFKNLKLFLAKEALFKKFVYGIENSGLGYAMFDPKQVDEILITLGEGFNIFKTDKKKEHIYNLLNSILRICGNNFYFDEKSVHATFSSHHYYSIVIDQIQGLNENQKSSIKGSNNKIVKFINSYSANNPFNINNEGFWLDFVFMVLCGSANNEGERDGLFVSTTGKINVFNSDATITQPVWYINLEKIVIRAVKADAPIYRTSTNKRIHLFHTHSACDNNEKGICTFSFEPFVESTGETAKELWLSNHIAYPIKFLKRKPIRLHTSELTGQTDDQITVQNEFKGIVTLDDSVKNLATYQALRKRQEVDIINVTTTMEVGIDIGALQAIFQGNMPPTRYNYQQRVGRGGRRGQAYSAAVTFCRGRSHDLFYYKYGLDKITGDIPTPPSLSIYKNNDGLNVKSIVKRMIVRTVLGEAFKSFDLSYEELDKKDNHGEFGKVQDYKDKNRAILINWINKNESQIKNIIRYFVSIDDYFLNHINNVLIKEIDAILFKDNNGVEKIKTNQSSLAHALAEGGMLPMFGMPSVVREFYHSFTKNHKTKQMELYAMSREIELAISEFAPGQIRTKDKAKYIVKGITQTLVKQGNDLKYMFNDIDPLSFQIELTKNADLDKDERAKFQIGEEPIIIPIAFRTAKLKENYGDKINVEDNETSYSKIETFPRPSEIDGSIEEINSNLKLRFNSADTYPKVLKLNTNNGKGFRLKRQTEDGLNKEYLDDANNATNYYLGYEKVTNLLGIIPNSGILGADQIDVSPYNQGNKIDWQFAGKAAGIYSSAFILQAIVAEELDIDPNEIEISPIQKFLDNNIIVPEIFLSDKLANGSGFVSYLYENFTEILNKLFNKEYKIYQSLLIDERALKYFYNQTYHPIIEPLLGLSYLRLLKDKNYKAGAVNNDLSFDEIIGILKKMEQAGKIFSDNFGFDLKKNSNGLFYLEKDNLKYVITHPFWNTKNQNVDSLYRFGNFGTNSIDDVKYIDYFNMIHRPLFVYNELMK